MFEKSNRNTKMHISNELLVQDCFSPILCISDLCSKFDIKYSL